MKIVVLDGYTENPGDLSWESLEALGNAVIFPRTPIDKIVERIENAEIVLTNKVPITKETIDACPTLKFVGVLATGFNVVDTEYAKQKGIIVSNIPTYGTSAVAQFAIGLLLEACHHIGHHSNEVYKGRWEKNDDWCFWDYPLIELDNKTMGIIGFGRIGQTVGKMANAFGMNIQFFDDYATSNADNAFAKKVTLETLLSSSDVISLHCPLTKETDKLINESTISKMKDGVIIINNSRGQLINEQDLANALNSGKVAVAGLDVVSTEPILNDNPLLKAKNCIITPHISWAPKESRQRLMDIAVNNVKQFIDGSPVNVVNK